MVNDSNHIVKASRDRKYVFELMEPVFLIGFMGAGKSSAARKLARSCGSMSIDLDSYLSRQEGLKIAEIFEQFGEIGFRQREACALAAVADLGPSFVSCGGGVVAYEESVRVLKERGTVVYMQVTVEEAISRISTYESRPLFADEAAARQLLDERIPLYEDAADIIINTSGADFGDSARLIKSALLRRGTLKKRYLD